MGRAFALTLSDQVTKGKAVLDNATLAWLVAMVIQLVVKPLLLQVWPRSHSLQNTITRAAVGVVAYAVILCNTAAARALTWPLAWSLLPRAGIIAAGAIAAYHILTSDGLPDLPPALASKAAALIPQPDAGGPPPPAPLSAAQPVERDAAAAAPPPPEPLAAPTTQ